MEDDEYSDDEDDEDEDEDGEDLDEDEDVRVPHHRYPRYSSPW